MKLFGWSLPLALMMLTTVGLAQQSSDPISTVEHQAGRPAAKSPSLSDRDHALEVAEDTEIFRELLGRYIGGLFAHSSEAWLSGSLTDHHGVHGTIALSERGSFSAAECIACHTPSSMTDFVPRELLATHLPSYGIVYQFRAPALREAPREQPGADEATPLSEWERIRRQLIEEPPEESQTTEQGWLPSKHVKVVLTGPPTREELAGKLLDLLGEHGHQFRHLEADARLTIAVTFPHFVRAQHASGWKGTRLETGSEFRGVATAHEGDASERHPRALGGSTRPSLNSTANGSSAYRGDTEPQGDLHMRQSNYRAAIESYETALRRAGVRFLADAPVILDDGVSEIIAPDMLNEAQRALVQKLVQAHVGAGNVDKAQRLLEALKRGDASGSTNAASGSSENGAKQIPLPGRVTVSARKADCDALAAGSISRAEFRRRAVVTHLDPVP